MKRLIFPLFIFIFTFAAHAQWDAKEVAEKITELNTFHILGADEQVNSNIASLNQIGDENTIETVQQNTGVASNQILSVQLQDGNYGSIEQEGEGHQSVLFQDGLGNIANLQSNGSDTYTFVWQKGDNNEVKSELTNDNLYSRTAMLIQLGNQNKIELPAEVQAQEVKVVQFGNGHEAVVKDNTFDSPIEVTQTAGFGGEGMQVEINTSYFSFPMRN